MADGSGVLVETIAQSGGVALVLVSALVILGRSAARFLERFVDRVLAGLDKLADRVASDTAATTQSLQAVTVELSRVSERLLHVEARVTEVRTGTPVRGVPVGDGGGGYGPMRGGGDRG
jgi:hypothetical protein